MKVIKHLDPSKQRSRLKRNVDDLRRILEEEHDNLGFLFKMEARKLIEEWERQIYSIDHEEKEESDEHNA